MTKRVLYYTRFSNSSSSCTCSITDQYPATVDSLLIPPMTLVSFWFLTIQDGESAQIWSKSTISLEKNNDHWIFPRKEFKSPGHRFEIHKSNNRNQKTLRKRNIEDSSNELICSIGVESLTLPLSIQELISSKTGSHAKPQRERGGVSAGLKLSSFSTGVRKRRERESEGDSDR